MNATKLLYRVSITETFTRTIYIPAEDENDAAIIAEELANDDESLVSADNADFSRQIDGIEPANLDRSDAEDEIDYGNVYTRNGKVITGQTDTLDDVDFGEGED